MSSSEYFADGKVLKFARPVNGIKVEQRVSDGFVNGTAMCVAHGKDISDWLKTDDAWEFVVALASDLGIVPKDPKSGNSVYTRISAVYPTLVIVKRGSPEAGGGTWLHPDLAVYLAQWCNKVFAIQVSRWIREWLTAGQNPFKVDLDKEFEAWQQRYDTRVYLKDFLRPELMSAVIQWAVANNKSPITLCSQVHDVMNLRVQGHKSKQLKTLNGLPLGDLLRDYFDASPLVTYSALNTLARNAIIDRDIEPIQAVNEACDQFLGKNYDPKPIPLAKNLYAEGRRLIQAKKRQSQASIGTQLALPFGNKDQAS
jgi:hypothetical protein